MCNKYNEKVYDSAHFAGLYDKFLAIYRRFCYNEPKNENGVVSSLPTVKKLTESVRDASKKIIVSGKRIKQRCEQYSDSYHNKEILISEEEIIQTVTRIESVRIDRNDFLTQLFTDNESIGLDDILEKGPVGAGADRIALRKTAFTLARKETEKSGLLNISDDIIKNRIIPVQALLFYAAAVRIIQQTAYLYGERDFWNSADSDTEKTIPRLYLYYSVMEGSGKAEKALKLLSSSVASKSFNKLTENFLEKAVYQPIFKPAAKALKIKSPKTVFNRIIDKAMPIVKNAVADGINLALHKGLSLEEISAYMA